MYISKMKMPEVVNDDVVVDENEIYKNIYIYTKYQVYDEEYICMYRSCVCICIFYIQSLTELSFFALLSRLSVLLNHTRVQYYYIIYI